MTIDMVFCSAAISGNISCRKMRLPA